MQMTTITISQPSSAGDDHTGAHAAATPVRMTIGLEERRLPHIVAITRATSPVSAAAETPLAADPQFPQTLDAGLATGEAPTILPTQSEGWTGTPAIQLSRGGVELFPAFAVTHTAHTADSFTFTAEDAEARLTLTGTLAIGPEGLVHVDTAITNDATADNDAVGATDGRAEATLVVNRLAPVVPLPPQVSEVESCTGHHLRERALQRQKLTEGVFAKESRMGRPNFNATTLLTAGERGFGFEHGLVVSAHVAFSGNSVTFVERTPYTHGVIGGGELVYAGEITLKPGETYHAPCLLVALGDGLNDVASRFHAYLRARHPELAKPRPVMLNTWEAMYFAQSEGKVIALADHAAEVGVERFVIDDGWFKGRRDDTKALGDWQVDETLWPEGLGTVAHHVHDLGMEFGLWFEPEMVSPDSDVARAHPDWMLKPTATRLPMASRAQQVIDLTNPAAARYVEAAIDTLVSEYHIDYIKWDHNRFLTEPISPASGRPAVHAQTEAFYGIVDRLRARHPGLEIESCSSGGGRIDAGVLERCSRVWASDCTDPVERADIQRGTSLIVPPEMIGEHISESPNHATRRATSLTTRAAMAFFGHLGIEWNIMKLDDSGLARLKRWVELYKERREALPQATLVHADTPDPAVRVDGLVAPDRSRAVFRFAAVASSEEYPYGLIRLPGLDPAARYRIRPLGGVDLYADEFSPNCRTTLGWWTDEGVVVDGATLAQWGVRPPQLAPEHAVLIDVTRA
ncbi:alpha-galactosidase [Bifidobacterium stellenboschense]|uniref:Alpha-galactosidase n=1 Tax=Bifidobacterium stellenboschense TaxID=762211 RepID=A0A087DNB7_9BIFI|nr:alpha-galactosidase [Bifidobacterium stellenboschense]KFI97017.1 alpha-galactosidase [Bifidobacterium stellenboschense]